MINYIGKFLLVIFDIKKKPLCEERLLFYIPVSHPYPSGINSTSMIFFVDCFSPIAGDNRHVADHPKSVGLFVLYEQIVYFPVFFSFFFQGLKRNLVRSVGEPDILE